MVNYTLGIYVRYWWRHLVCRLLNDLPVSTINTYINITTNDGLYLCLYTHIYGPEVCTYTYICRDSYIYVGFNVLVRNYIIPYRTASCARWRALVRAQLCACVYYVKIPVLTYMYVFGGTRLWLRAHMCPYGYARLHKHWRALPCACMYGRRQQDSRICVIWIFMDLYVSHGWIFYMSNVLVWATS